jgi:hypothetical protein
MAHFLASPLNLEEGDLIVAVVLSNNAVGPSINSAPNTAGQLVQVAPKQPPNAPTRNILTTKSSIVIDYPTLANSLIGGSPILSLNLRWDKGLGGNVWYSLIGENPDSLSSTFTISGLVTGRTYRFKYRARNAHGFGPFSEYTSIITAINPAKPSKIVTLNSGTDLIAQWTQSENGGTPITGYKVEFKSRNTADFYEYSPTCSGIFPLTHCTIPLSIFEFSPYNYL